MTTMTTMTTITTITTISRKRRRACLPAPVPALPGSAKLRSYTAVWRFYLRRRQSRIRIRSIRGREKVRGRRGGREEKGCFCWALLGIYGSFTSPTGWF